MATKKKSTSSYNFPKINKEETLQKLKAQDNQGDGEGSLSSFWKPDKDGAESLVRIVPPKDGDAFKRLYIHYVNALAEKGQNARGVQCLKRNYNKKCPFCEMGSELWMEYKKTEDAGTPDESLKKLAKDFFAPRKPRTFSPVVVRGEEDKGVRWWSYPPTTSETITELLDDPDVGDFTDVFSGRDLKVKVKKQEGNNFASPVVMLSLKEIPLAETEEQMIEFIENIPDFEGLFDVYSAEQMREMIKDTFGDDGVSQVVSSSEENEAEQTLDEIVNEVQSEDGDDLPF